MFGFFNTLRLPIAKPCNTTGELISIRLAARLPIMLKALSCLQITSTWLQTPAKVPLANTSVYLPQPLVYLTQPSQRQSYRSTVVAGSYGILQLDPRLCLFHRTSMCHAPQRGCTIKATLVRGVFAEYLDVFCKIVDIFRRRNCISIGRTTDPPACRFLNKISAALEKVFCPSNSFRFCRLQE